jgi:protein-L-isoaspartate(D-aspartate) O-methyltransferase
MFSDSANFRSRRAQLVAKVEAHLGPFDPLHLRALLDVPRERFVRASDLADSQEDVPLALDDTGHATISAPHAYLLSFRLLDLKPGDSLVELGTGSGYGAALASYIVGEQGGVRTFEIDPTLAAWAARLLGDRPNVAVSWMDAMQSTAHWGRHRQKIVGTFAVATIPPDWISGLVVGGRLAIPVGPVAADQRLILVERRPDRAVFTDHGGVRYVSNRSLR